jgi:outer membrane murein-binding lipoprotein Lpp
VNNATAIHADVEDTQAPGPLFKAIVAYWWQITFIGGLLISGAVAQMQLNAVRGDVADLKALKLDVIAANQTRIDASLEKIEMKVDAVASKVDTLSGKIEGIK